MQNEMLVSMLMLSSMVYCLRATSMAASYALFILCRFGCDLMLMCVMVLVLGLATPDPRMGLPLICEPSVYTKSRGVHFRFWGLVCSIRVVVCGCTIAGVFV